MGVSGNLAAVASAGISLELFHGLSLLDAGRPPRDRSPVFQLFCAPAVGITTGAGGTVAVSAIKQLGCADLNDYNGPFVTASFSGAIPLGIADGGVTAALSIGLNFENFLAPRAGVRVINRDDLVPRNITPAVVAEVIRNAVRFSQANVNGAVTRALLEQTAEEIQRAGINFARDQNVQVAATAVLRIVRMMVAMGNINVLDGVRQFQQNELDAAGRVLDTFLANRVFDNIAGRFRQRSAPNMITMGMIALIDLFTNTRVTIDGNELPLSVHFRGIFQLMINLAATMSNCDALALALQGSLEVSTRSVDAVGAGLGFSIYGTVGQLPRETLHGFIRAGNEAIQAVRNVTQQLQAVEGQIQAFLQAENMRMQQAGRWERNYLVYTAPVRMAWEIGPNVLNTQAQLALDLARANVTWTNASANLTLQLTRFLNPVAYARGCVLDNVTQDVQTLRRVWNNIADEIRNRR